MCSLFVISICLVVINTIETSSHALAFAITIIAFYPEVQQKIYEEVKGVWPNECPALGATSVHLCSFLTLTYLFLTSLRTDV
jgi:cytochrome P450